MTGYDKVSGRYWATWNDSMSTGIMVMEGTCDAEMTCTFTGTYNDPIAKGPVASTMTFRWTKGPLAVAASAVALPPLTEQEVLALRAELHHARSEG